MARTSTTEVIEFPGVKTIVTTLPDGKKLYRTVVTKNRGAAGTPHLAKIAREGSSMTLTAARGWNSWTSTELSRLRRSYPVMTVAELEAAFPNHSIKSIRTTASDLKISKDFGARKWLRIAAAHVPVCDFAISLRRI